MRRVHLHFHPDEISQALLCGTALYDPDDYEVGRVTGVKGAGPTATLLVEVSDAKIPVCIRLPADQVHLIREPNGHIFGQIGYRKDQLARLEVR